MSWSERTAASLENSEGSEATDAGIGAGAGATVVAPPHLISSDAAITLTATETGARCPLLLGITSPS
jgi:hypothetical protein